MWQKYEERRIACTPKRKLSDPKLFQFVKAKFLEEHWSPEQIAGRLRYEDSTMQISYTTIYRAIYGRMFDEPGLSYGNRGAIRRLRHRGKTCHTKDHVKKRGKIQIPNELKDRPVEANERSRIGDWEADTVAGTPGRACLVTLVDRKSRFLVGGKATRETSSEVAQVMVESLAGHCVETIPPDRGKEFSRHAEVTEALDKVQFYFPLPHHPWDRETNENTNGLLREYFPKGKDLTGVSEEYIQKM